MATDKMLTGNEFEIALRRYWTEDEGPTIDEAIASAWAEYKKSPEEFAHLKEFTYQLGEG